MTSNVLGTNYKKGPYGTGNWSFGNFDFDPKYYPNPKEFIANLSASGFDFQVSSPRSDINDYLGHILTDNRSGWPIEHSSIQNCTMSQLPMAGSLLTRIHINTSAPRSISRSQPRITISRSI